MVTYSRILVWRIPIDRGARQAIAHGVTKSWTRLSNSRHTCRMIIIDCSSNIAYIKGHTKYYKRGLISRVMRPFPLKYFILVFVYTLFFYPLKFSFKLTLKLAYCASVQFSSVTQSCLTLCNPIDCSMPGFPGHHQLLELTQTHVH